MTATEARIVGALGTRTLYVCLPGGKLMLTGDYTQNQVQQPQCV